MSLAVDADQRALAESVAAFAHKIAPLSRTREHLADYAEGLMPADLWTALCEQGLHALHLPADYGGDECGLATLAVVVEQLSTALFPGPYLSTVTASALAMAATNAQPLLAAFAAGLSGAVVTGPDLRATRAGAAWVVSGISDPAPGLPGARRIVVRATVDGDSGASLWFWVSAADAAASLQVVSAEAVDLTRSLGHAEFDAYRVEENRVLDGIEPAVATLWMTTLAAAEATGICRWCLDTTVEYVRVREQFGRPIGSFQAVQHKTALMLVRAEVAGAATWDAARAETQPAAQRFLAAASAALTALPAAIDQAVDCVSLLGGIGFTWEHDAHLYWRRAIALVAAAGGADAAARELGERSLVDDRDFSFVTADTLPELRASVGAVLDEVLALPDDEIPAAGWAPARGASRRARLAADGLVAPHYPRPYGLGAGPAEQAVIADEFTRRALAQPELGIGAWVLPTLIEHGDAGQRARFVVDTLLGKVIWCQLFSEPGAGSDLAGLSTAARKVEGGWVITGQKVWNSQAQEADWAICLARTDATAPKHAGLTYFLIPMNATGVEVRPLRQITGIWEFNEVFLDEVYVPDDQVVAQPGDGWRIAVTTLSNERLAMGSTTFGHGSSTLVRRLLESGDHTGTRDDALRVLGRNVALELSVAALNLRNAVTRMNGTVDGNNSSNSVRKVWHAIAQRDASRALVSILGPRAAVGHPQQPYTFDVLGLPAILFGGGTIEIQLDIIARRVLSLPR
ncbi:acyl-CoA dehydrogenase [Nocardia goodfellowii]|uniref:Alkylation response protein AidB-like acyl-CoA dehydrogenase n=1 Tax=Nocardia goodfellowii TaxID=882446 RepID=A0ABS4QM48_9NOCA|nr:acyl-CoA dehydrogenase [Nocardia goodfellowii]MBP2191741.1 alkylation response protein AidB-like acyl-CoA dehydrogenase [Nocardia goodfellowii]